MGTSGCLEINGTVVTKCRNKDIPADGHVKIPAGVTKIEGSDHLSSSFDLFIFDITGFRFCNSLKSVSIPASVTEIGAHAFYWCTSLASVTIPEGVTKIGMGAFIGCTSLTSVTILGSVTEISSGAFSGCTSLASVTIPASVRHIGEDAFAKCPLKEVHYGGGKDAWLAITGDRPKYKGLRVNLYPKGLPGNSADGTGHPGTENTPQGDFSNFLQELFGIWGVQPSGGADAGKQTATASTKMKCPSCETEWTLGKSANRPTACPFCGASLA